jgi:hypothetical protein
MASDKPDKPGMARSFVPAPCNVNLPSAPRKPLRAVAMWRSVCRDPSSLTGRPAVSSRGSRTTWHWKRASLIGAVAPPTAYTSTPYMRLTSYAFSLRFGCPARFPVLQGSSIQKAPNALNVTMRLFSLLALRASSKKRSTFELVL